MKIFVLTLVMIVFTGCSSTKTLTDDKVVSNQSESVPAPTDFHDASTWLLGYFTRQMMTSPPHSEWFQKQYDGYRFNDEAVNKLTMLGTEGLTIKIVMGSWCPDSRREVPRFMKILDFLKFPAGSITFVGVDDSKFAPVGGYDKLDIERVPTIIFYKNNNEAGRIIENPVTSLEQDMVDILTKE
jgi:thiol-disulfide isomerase/thioredoxin